MLLLQKLAADPELTIKNGLRFLHFFGVVLGPGAATLLDFYIMHQVLKGKVEKHHAEVAEFCSKIVVGGLIVLWITGLSFLCYYTYCDPGKLLNQKIWVKLLVVGILTINGLYIHGHVLPHLTANVGRRLLEGLTPVKEALFIGSGVISGVSWLFAILLGAITQFNGLPAYEVFGAYILLLGLATIATFSFAHFFLRTHPETPSMVEQFQEAASKA